MTTIVASACAEPPAFEREEKALRSACWDASCCPPGSTIVQGTAYSDTLIATGSSCFVALEGDDSVTGAAGSTLLGGRGNDVLNGTSGTEVIYGHEGNDHIYGYGGNDEMTPGPGMDQVYAGSGDDEVIITTFCELTRGEILDGGPGLDTLTTSWTVSELVSIGVQIAGFEHINIVAQDFDKAECCDTDVCGDYGTCTESLAVVECQCDPGYGGRMCSYELSEVLVEFLDLPDPGSWSLDTASGRYYRHATQMELETNDWLPGTFLVTADGLDASFSSGANPISVTIPTTPTTTTTLDLDLRAVDTSKAFIELDGSARTAVEIDSLKPTINLYASKVTGGESAPDLHGAVVVGIAAEEFEQFQLFGTINRTGESGIAYPDQVSVMNADPTWQLDTVPGPSVTASDLYLVHWSPQTETTSWPPSPVSDVCALPIHIPDNVTDWHPCDLINPDPPGQCGDGIDNDGDGLEDDDDTMCEHAVTCDPATAGKNYPPHSHTVEAGRYFGLLGDVAWCTRHKSNWVTAMYALGRQEETRFYKYPGEPGEYNQAYNDLIDAGQMPMRFSAAKCWTLEDDEHAWACRSAENTDCGPFSTGNTHEYPYRGLGNVQVNWVQYLGRADIDLAHAVNLSPPENSIDYPLDLLQIVYWDSVHEGFEGKAIQAECTHQSMAHVSMINDEEKIDGMKLSSSKIGAHEFGHTYSCDHCDARIFTAGTVDSWSLMHTDAGENCYAGQQVNGEALNFAKICASHILARVNSRDVGICGLRGPTFGY